VETAILAAVSATGVGASKRMGRSYEKDLTKVEAARLKAIEAVRCAPRNRSEPCRLFTGVIAAVLYPLRA
jgi:hypothetical protein